MPPVSEKQRRAMYAAKAGHSTLGIPQKVGAEYVAKDHPGKLPEDADREREARKKNAVAHVLAMRHRTGP